MFGPVTHDDELNEWRCDVDEFTTVISKDKQELEDTLDDLEARLALAAMLAMS